LLARRGVIASPADQPGRPLVECAAKGVIELDCQVAELDAEGRKRAVNYANSQIGKGFGYLALVGVSIYLLTGLPVRLMRSGHQICSELVMRALQAGGLLKDADPSLTLPADLAKSFNVRP